MQRIKSLGPPLEFAHMWRDESELLDFLSRIYEASSNPDKWSEVLSYVAKATNARSATLLYRDADFPEMNLGFAFGIEPEIANMYMEQFIFKDPFAVLYLEHAGIGNVTADHLIYPNRSDLARDYPEFHDQFMVPSDVYHLCGTNLVAEEARYLGFSVHRGKADGPFAEREISQMQKLVPHFQRSFRIHREYLRLKRKDYMLMTALDQVVIGLIVMWPDKKIAYINPMGKQIVDKHPAISMAHDSIRISSQGNSLKFNQLIDQCLQSRGAYNEQVGGLLSFTDSTTGMPLSLMVVPLSSTAMPNDLSPIFADGVAVFVSDPTSELPICVEGLQSTYELTPKEAETAVALANGMNVDQIADRFAVSRETVRTHLKNLFNKTSTTSQAELVRLIVSGPFGNVLS